MFTGEAYQVSDETSMAEHVYQAPVEILARPENDRTYGDVVGSWTYIPSNSPVAIGIPTGILQKTQDRDFLKGLAVTGFVVLAIACVARYRAR